MPRMQLPVADVERDHAGRPALEQDVAEAARRRPDVDAVPPARIDPQLVERVRELLASSRDVRRQLLDRELARLVHLRPRFVEARHETGQHEGLRLRAALRQPAFHQQDVDPLLHAPKANDRSALALLRRWKQTAAGGPTSRSSRV